jgi:hypothetical protein
LTSPPQGGHFQKDRIMAEKKYHFYTDGGHGWLAVKRKELEDLGIVDQITPYSYQRGNTVYLEEDCDMGLFHKAKSFTDCTYYEHHYRDGNSPIRSYARFSKEVRTYAAGMRVNYGGNNYTLREDLGRGAWKVESDGGIIYRMKPKQLIEAEVMQ